MAEPGHELGRPRILRLCGWPWPLGGRVAHRGGGEPEHQVADEMPVDHLVHALVAVGEQAVVAGPDAAFPAGAGFVGAEVSAAVRVEVHDLQCRPGRLGQRAGVIDQAAERARRRLPRSL